MAVGYYDYVESNQTYTSFKSWLDTFTCQNKTVCCGSLLQTKCNSKAIEEVLKQCVADKAT